MGKDRTGKKITIVDIAKRLGISPATVSNALTGERYVKKETIERVRKMVEELDYRPNMIARALRSKKGNIVGLLTTNINDPFNAEVISGIEDVISRNGYILVINSTRFNKDIEENALKQLMNLLIDGLVFLGGSCDFSHINEIVPGNIPMVFLNRRSAGSRLTEITVDYKRAVKKLVGYLVGMGHRKIGYLGWKNKYSIIPDEEYNGYVEGLQERGIRLDDGFVFLRDSVPIREFRGFREYNEDIDTVIRRENVTALICQSDPIALGILEMLRKKGFDIPGDISLTGIGNIMQSQTSFPSLTTVHVPKARMGRYGAETLLDLIRKGKNRKQTIYLKTTLIERGSVRNLT